jgi:hypothetical protein
MKSGDFIGFGIFAISPWKNGGISWDSTIQICGDFQHFKPRNPHVWYIGTFHQDRNHEKIDGVD